MHDFPYGDLVIHNRIQIAEKVDMDEINTYRALNDAIGNVDANSS